MNSQFSHIVKANTIVNNYRRNAVSSAIKLFDLSDYITNQDQLIENLAKSHQDLHYDYYDVGFKIEKEIKSISIKIFNTYKNEWLELWLKIGTNKNDKRVMIDFWKSKFKKTIDLSVLEKIEPHRKRSCYQYIVSPTNKKHEWNILENGIPIFKQDVSDSRSRIRTFKAPDIKIIRDHKILELISSIAQILAFNPNVFNTKFKFTMHQMLTYAKGEGANEPAPEGIHQDGASFIISAIVIERVNVSGGISSVYYNKPKNRDDVSKLAFEHQLTIGEGIMQADKFNNYWHGISPIYRVNKKNRVSSNIRI